MIELEQNYLSDFTNHTRSMPKFYLKEDSSGIIFENITLIELNSLYSSMAASLKNHFSYKYSNLEKIDYFLKNKKQIKSIDTQLYQSLKIMCNSFYGELLSKDQNLILHYLSKFWDDFIKQHQPLILSIEVDRLFINLKKSELNNQISFDRGLKGITFDILPLKYFYTEGHYKYLYQDDSGKITSRGYKDQSLQQLELQIKRELRRRAIAQLGL